MLPALNLRLSLPRAIALYVWGNSAIWSHLQKEVTPRSSSVPSLDTVVPLARPADTFSTPPPEIAPDMALPPADTVSVPLDRTVAALAMPPADTTSLPLLATVVPLSSPRTTSVPALDTVAANALPPAATVSTPPDLAAFRAKLKDAGLYKEWKEKLGAEAWALLEEITGPLT